MEHSEETKEQAPGQERPINVWRGTPRIWERCMLCELNKKCAATGVVRGSRACADARYALMKR